MSHHDCGTDGPCGRHRMDTFGRSLVAPALNENIENEAVRDYQEFRARRGG